MASRDRLVVRTLRCGRSKPGSNPGPGMFIFILFLSLLCQGVIQLCFEIITLTLKSWMERLKQVPGICFLNSFYLYFSKVLKKFSSYKWFLAITRNVQKLH